MLRGGMPDPAPLIGYESNGLEDPTAYRLLRRIVGWAAIVAGAKTVVLNALYVALSRGWVAQPQNMSWGMGGRLRVAIITGETIAMSALLLSGVLLLRRSRGAVALLRCSALALCIAHAAQSRGIPVHRPGLRQLLD
jgi:hypothetical protein